MTRDQAQKLYQRFAAAYPAVEVAEETAEIFPRFLSELGWEEADRAADEAIRSLSRFPTIADVRRLVAEEQLGLPSAHEAYSSIFDPDAERHALTRYVTEIFGGEYNVRTSELPAATRSQFIKIFDELRDEAVRRGELPKVVVHAQERRQQRAQEGPPEPPGLWATIRERFRSLPEDERARRLKEARRDLLKRGEIDKDFLVPPVIEHEALQVFAAENGWMEKSA